MNSVIAAALLGAFGSQPPAAPLNHIEAGNGRVASSSFVAASMDQFASAALRSAPWSVQKGDK